MANVKLAAKAIHRGKWKREREREEGKNDLQLNKAVCGDLHGRVLLNHWGSNTRNKKIYNTKCANDEIFIVSTV